MISPWPAFDVRSIGLIWNRRWWDESARALAPTDRPKRANGPFSMTVWAGRSSPSWRRSRRILASCSLCWPKRGISLYQIYRRTMLMMIIFLSFSLWKESWPYFCEGIDFSFTVMAQRLSVILLILIVPWQVRHSVVHRQMSNGFQTSTESVLL